MKGENIKERVCGKPSRSAFAIRGISWEDLNGVVLKCFNGSYEGVRGTNLYSLGDDGEGFRFYKLWNEWGSPSGSYGREERIGGQNIPDAFVLKGNERSGHLLVVPDLKYDRQEGVFKEFSEGEGFKWEYYEFFAGVVLEILKLSRRVSPENPPRLEAVKVGEWYEKSL